MTFKTPKHDSSARKIGIDAGLAGRLKRHKTAQAEDALKLGAKLPRGCASVSRADCSDQNREGRVTYLRSSKGRRVAPVSMVFGCMICGTHATQLLSSGVTINVVADRLGHSSPVITLTVYGHLLKNAEDQAVAVSGPLLEAALASA